MPVIRDFTPINCFNKYLKYTRAIEIFLKVSENVYMIII